MTRKELGMQLTAVFPATRKQHDEHILETLCHALELGWAMTEAERKNYAGILRRYLAGDYPTPRRGKPSTAPRDRAIAEAYVLLHDCQRDQLAANRIATHCREHGVAIKAQTVTRIAARWSNEARASVAANLAHGRTTFTRESMIRAQLADALRRAVKP